MKISLFFTLIIIFVFCSLLKADTTIPGGNVSGTWTAAGSPYLVQGNITVHTDSILNIEPGVSVNFQGAYSFTVNGHLEAIGTVTDSIHFFPANTTNGWNTMRFENAPDSSHLAYCTISYSGNIIVGMGGIICTNSNPVITHCRISNNQARGGVPTIAGGIALNNSNAEISWCDISKNGKPDYGGGIYISNSSPVITGCNISGNESVVYGGGIYITGSSIPTITGCTVQGNESNWEGGGIYCAGGGTNFLECTIGYNESYLSGGGIYSATGNMSLNHCTIEHNQCSNFAAQGGGIFATGGTLAVDHCTFYGNYVLNWDVYGMEIHTGGSVAMTVSNSIFYNDDNLIGFGSTSPASVSYSDFQSTYGPYFTGNIPAGLGQLTTTNANGDSCDTFYNIFLDPLFVNPVAGDFHLQAASTCIDAGDPASPLDPDNTVTDIGRYFFNQGIPVIIISDTLLEFGSVVIGQQNDLSLTIHNAGTDVLVLDSVFNQLPQITHSWNAADSLIAQRDSLVLILSFSPTDTLTYSDTLTIENNHQTQYVILNGSGLLLPAPFIAASDTALNFGAILTGHQADSSFTLFNLGSDTLEILSISNHYNIFSHNFTGADSLIPPGDSLEIMVTFAPTDTGFFQDTLFISNNDKPLQVYLSGTGDIDVGINDENFIPTVYALYPAYPNPFNPTSTIKFDLPKTSFVELKVFDVLGKQVGKMISEQKAAGRYKYIFDGSNLASGLYFVQMRADDFHAMQKILLVK